MRDLTKEEKSAIRKLKNLAKVWPSSLWLFAGESGLLDVLITNDKGEMVYCPHGGSVDPEYVVDTIEISSDGGGY